MPYELLRQNFMPHIVKILFIGESRPVGETFFYSENSNLFRYTKSAFDSVFNNEFNCNSFKSMGCWLYDVCDVPVNHLPPHQRIFEIQNGIPKLIKTINILKPEFIIVVKRGVFRDLIMTHLAEIGYVENINTEFLPFPACGRQREYTQQLIQIIQSKSVSFVP